MAKTGFSSLVSKVQSTANDVAGKVKSGASDAANNVRDTADGLIKTVREKVMQKPESAGKQQAPAKKDQPVKKEAEAREKLDDALRMAADQYNDANTMMNDNGATLYRERTRSVDLILHIESLVNSIANRPKEIDAEVAEIITQRESFIDTCEFAKAELEAAKKSALGAGAGVATGAAIVSVAPTVAIWVATTFGTASTGTAISALSGAAATNAALAWLGGGALAAGGGGMAAGHAFLALAGPIGWSIAGVTLLSSIVLFSLKKLKLDKKKKEEIEAIKNNTNIAQKISAQIQTILDETIALRDNLRQQYNDCLSEYGKDFLSIPAEQQIHLGALVNNTKALAASLSKSI